MEEAYFTTAHMVQIDRVYNAAAYLIAVMTEMDELSINADDYGEVADMVMDFLVNRGYVVHFPTHIVDEAKGIDIIKERITKED